MVSLDQKAEFYELGRDGSMSVAKCLKDTDWASATANQREIIETIIYWHVRRARLDNWFAMRVRKTGSEWK